MNKPTPGPWAVHAHATDTYTIYVAGRHWDSWAVAHVGYTKEDEANARLISAAPDLLEALEFMLSVFNETYPDVADDEEDREAWAKARAAIRKATGE